MLLQERNKHCDMDQNLVHDVIRGQIRNPEVARIIKSHYEGCNYCQKLTNPKFYSS